LSALEEWGREATLWVTDEAPEGGVGVSANRVTRELGQEWGVVVFDACSGFDADAFGAVSGTVRGGGVLILLAPPLASWPGRASAAASPGAAGRRFVARMLHLLRGAEGVAVIPQEGTCLLPEEQVEVQSPTPRALEDGCRTRDQRAAVEAVLRVAQGHRRRPLVLMSDRGRGKSAALGIAAARLLAGGKRCILVTAPSRATAAPLFAHAARHLPDGHADGKGLRAGEGALLFVAPDALLQDAPNADLLLVDEAAAIPPALLGGLLRRYARIVFATTVHGYEGSGRGFEVRFRQQLDAETPGWRLLRLHTPIRWSPRDPLERWVFDLLLLDASPVSDDTLQRVSLGGVAVSPLTQAELAADEPSLRQVFGLLRLAHYRTTPHDLVQLLDGHGLETWVLSRDGDVVAVALVAEEGALEPTLATAIRAGRRRLRGHLLPQSLLAHQGLADAGDLRYLRVVRIAVHPAVRRRGLGLRLLHALQNHAQRQGMDCIGASFAASGGLLGFWRRGGYSAVRVGVSRGTRSGAPSLMVLQGLSVRGRLMVSRARERFHADFAHLLAGPLADLNTDLALALLRQRAPVVAERVGGDAEMLAAFAYAQRSFESAYGALWRLLHRQIANAPRPAAGPGEALLVSAVLQHRPWSQLVTMSGCRGRRGVIGDLRCAVRELLAREGDGAVAAALRELKPRTPAKQNGTGAGLVGCVANHVEGSDG